MQATNDGATPVAMPAQETRQALDEYGAIWVRPRRAAQICNLGLTRIYELIGTGEVESRKCGGARLISVASLLALGEEQAPQFPAGLAAARHRRGADATT